MALVVPGGKLFLVGQLWKIVNELGAIGDSTGSVGGMFAVCKATWGEKFQFVGTSFSFGGGEVL